MFAVSMVVQAQLPALLHCWCLRVKINKACCLIAMIAVFSIAL
jgi:hypothetical protein